MRSPIQIHETNDLPIVILRDGQRVRKRSPARNASVKVLLGSEVKAVHPGAAEFERNEQQWRLAASSVDKWECDTSSD